MSGISLTVVALLMSSQLHAGASYLQIFVSLVLLGTGSGTALVPLTQAGLAGVDPADAGAASGLVNVTQQVGAALGLAVLVTVLSAAAGHAQLKAGTGVPTHLVHGLDVTFAVAALFGLAALVMVALLVHLPGTRQAEAVRTSRDAGEPSGTPRTPSSSSSTARASSGRARNWWPCTAAGLQAERGSPRAPNSVGGLSIRGTAGGIHGSERAGATGGIGVDAPASRVDVDEECRRGPRPAPGSRRPNRSPWRSRARWPGRPPSCSARGAPPDTSRWPPPQWCSAGRCRWRRRSAGRCWWWPRSRPRPWGRRCWVAVLMQGTMARPRPKPRRSSLGSTLVDVGGVGRQLGEEGRRPARPAAGRGRRAAGSARGASGGWPPAWPPARSWPSAGGRRRRS